MSALCVGKSWLFDSTDIGDHDQARKLCASCPVADWCHEQAQAALGLAGRRATTRGAVVVGTWAGRLYGVAHDMERVEIEDHMFSLEEARAAHSAWNKGARDDRSRIGERAYQRYRGRTRRTAA